VVAAQVHAGAYLGRFVVVVDEDIDVMNLEEVMWAICTRCDPAKDIDILRRCWSGPLDPIIPPGQKGLNSRAIIDATRPFEWRDKFPPGAASSPEPRAEGLQKWDGGLFSDGAVPGRPAAPGAGGGTAGG